MGVAGKAVGAAELCRQECKGKPEDRVRSRWRMGLRLALGNAIGYTSILKAELVLGLSVLVSVRIYVFLQVDSHKLHHIYYTIFKSDGKNISQFIRNLKKRLLMHCLSCLVPDLRHLPCITFDLFCLQSIA